MELQPIKTSFDIDTDKFITLERNPLTNITHIDLHDTFMATTTRLASFADGKFHFYTDNNTTQFISIMRAQPTLKQELNQVAIRQDEFEAFKERITKPLNEAMSKVVNIFKPLTTLV